MIILDHVQFEKNSYINRNKIRTSNGWQWLSVPVKNPTNTPIDQVEINSQYWRKKHLKSIEHNYSKSPFFDLYYPTLEKLYDEEYHLLDDFIDSTFIIASLWLRLMTPVIYSSELRPQHTKSELVLELCKMVDADEYLSGPQGRGYLNELSFKKAGIKITYHDYNHPIYKQMHPGFVPNMCILDLLFNYGDESRRML